MRTPFVIRHLHPYPRRQLLDGLDEPQSGVLHEKANGCPMRTATEAMVELLGRADGKRGGLFVMKRAAGSIVGPRFTQRNIPIDKINDLDSMEQLLDERLGDQFLSER